MHEIIKEFIEQFGYKVLDSDDMEKIRIVDKNGKELEKVYALSNFTKYARGEYNKKYICDVYRFLDNDVPFIDIAYLNTIKVLLNGLTIEINRDRVTLETTIGNEKQTIYIAFDDGYSEIKILKNKAPIGRITQLGTGYEINGLYRDFNGCTVDNYMNIIKVFFEHSLIGLNLNQIKSLQKGFELIQNYLQYMVGYVIKNWQVNLDNYLRSAEYKRKNAQVELDYLQKEVANKEEKIGEYDKEIETIQELINKRDLSKIKK